MSNIEKKAPFDLKLRTLLFSKSIIVFIKKLQLTPLSAPVLNQLIRSATSIGANFHEADNAESKKDFIHKLSICRKEAQETVYWLEVLPTLFAESEDEMNTLKAEAQELNLIFSAIIRKSKVRL